MCFQKIARIATQPEAVEEVASATARGLQVQDERFDYKGLYDILSKGGRFYVL